MFSYLIANAYPTQLRATATGWGIGIGRMGAIIGSVALHDDVGAAGQPSSRWSSAAPASSSTSRRSRRAATTVSPYAAAKGGVDALTASLAFEAAQKGVRWRIPSIGRKEDWYEPGGIS